MKVLTKIGLTLVILILAAPLLLYGALLVGELFPSSPRYDVFDDSEIILEVMTRTPDDREEDKATQYFALADGRRIRETAPFEPDPMTVYFVPDPSDIYVRKTNEETDAKASFTTLGLEDEHGNSVPLTGDFTAILTQLDEIDHWIMTAKIMEVQGRLFVYTELNVNLWDPCVLYQYDPDSGQLKELYTWNDQEPIGLRLHTSEASQAQ